MKTNLNEVLAEARYALRRVTWGFFSAVGLILVVTCLLVSEERKNDRLTEIIRTSQANESKTKAELNKICEIVKDQRHIIVREVPRVNLAWSPVINEICE